MQQTIEQIEQRQDAVVEQMSRIRVMRRGTVSEQHYQGRRKRKGGTGASGPYYIWQGYVNGKRFSQRVSATEVERIKQEIEQRRRFERLCAEYVGLGEALAQAGHEQVDQFDGVKKGLKSRSNRAGKLRK